MTRLEKTENLATIGTFRGALAGREGKHHPPKSGGCRVAGKHDELPDTVQLREQLKRDVAAEARSAMLAKKEELAQPKIARRRHEGKGRLTNKRETDGNSICERHQGETEGLFKPVRKIVGFPDPIGRELVCCVEFRQVVEIQRMRMAGLQTARKPLHGELSSHRPECASDLCV